MGRRVGSEEEEGVGRDARGGERGELEAEKEALLDYVQVRLSGCVAVVVVIVVVIAVAVVVFVVVVVIILVVFIKTLTLVLTIRPVPPRSALAVLRRTPTFLVIEYKKGARINRTHR